MNVETSTEEREANERTILLVDQDRRDSEYGSDGESPMSNELDEENPQVNVSGPSETINQDEGRVNRGFKFVYKKILNALPSFGDDDEDPNSEANEAALKFGAKQMILLVFPVFICMALVVIIQLSVENNVQGGFGQLGGLGYVIPEDLGNDNGGLIFLIAIANVIIILIIVVIMTIILVCLYKHRCYLIIRIWLMVASGSLLFVFSSFFFVEVLLVHLLPIDWISFIFLVWNFGAMGVVSIHWKGPLRLQQIYLILCSALSANVFVKYLPNWTTWLLLFAISIYDLVAVLSPKGPLRVLVETAKERNEPIFPSLIYSTTMIWTIGMADRGTSSNSGNKKNERSGANNGGGTNQDSNNEGGRANESNNDNEESNHGQWSDMATSLPPDEMRQGGTRRRVVNEREMEEQRDDNTNNQNEQQQEEEEEEPQGFKLGLGDFIFYSILVGKAASDSNGDWVVISSCFVAILIGLCMTTIILGIVRRALPALPISIFFGLIFYFTSQYLFAPFASILSTTQTFI